MQGPAMTPGVTIRPWQASDSVEALTALLHAGYAPLAAAGLNFTAATQDAAMTARRMADGCCWVAVAADGALVGTVSASGAFDSNRHGWARALPWFYRPDVGHFHQYTVRPDRQRQGIGAALLAAAEAWARGQGHRAMLLDTAEPATALRAHYARAGYAETGLVQWPGKTYRSVVMLKPLDGGPLPTVDDAAHGAAVVRALWAGFQARDWAGARALLADEAHLHWRASGEHLDDADAIVRVQQIYPEGWSIHVHEVTPLADGRVHSLVQVDHGPMCFLAHTLWRLQGGRIVHGDETWATCEAPPAWRTAEAIGAYRRVPLPGAGS